ncbi:MAG: methyltransferase domain-containing protein [Chloroflexota bacterium]|nr:methyltransferase domain-containing protein [Chloroflexota bacterium]MDQ5867838.1 methyltransferase domain-containing protein [Chloroflexota bacterium]
MPSTEPFDAHTSAFKDYQLSAPGRLLHNISGANVQRHMERRPLRVLDVGGGNGVDAVALAKQGHLVAILDPTAELLNDARVSAEAAAVIERMEFYEAELADIPSLFPESQFDVILCHNVLQYVDDLKAALATICDALLPGGLISVICVNRYSEAYREVLQQLQPSAALEKLDTKTIFSGVFKTEVKAYAAEEAIEALRDLECVLVAQYGVRCVYDYIPDNELKNSPAFFAELERLEHELSGRFPYYLLARFFQIIARKVAV